MANYPTTKPGYAQRTEFMWEGNRLLQERLFSIAPTSVEGTEQQARTAQTRTYVWEPDSFVPLARIDDIVQSLSKNELLARNAQALAAKKAYNWDESDDGDDDGDLSNFAQIKQTLAVPPTIVQLQAMGEQAQGLQQAMDTAPHQAVAHTTTRIPHYHCDHLGTPQELTDEDGKLVWSANHAA